MSETQSRTLIARDKGNGKSGFNEYRVKTGADAKVLERNGGNSCIIT